MNELQAILIVIAFALAIATFYFAQRSAQTGAELRKARSLADQRQRETEEAEKKLSHRNDDLEQTRKQLQDTRNKLERLKKDLHAAKTQEKARTEAEAPAAASSAAGRVRITSQELEAEHRKRVERLERELQAATERAQRLEQQRKARAAEAEKAARALMEETEVPEQPKPASGDAAPEAQIETLTRRLDALQRAATQRERDLKKRLNKADSDARAAQKRAANNHALYLVIKGQLEVAEDRLALLRRKYEGAKSPAELARREAEATSEPADSAVVAPEAPRAAAVAANDPTGEHDPPPDGSTPARSMESEPSSGDTGAETRSDGDETPRPDPTSTER